MKIAPCIVSFDYFFPGCTLQRIHEWSLLKYCISYLFEGYPNITQSFKLDASTGQITTNKILDRESHTTYLICVKASKPGQRRKRELPSRQELEAHLRQYSTGDVLFLLVTVSDINDNKPIFAKANVYTCKSRDFSTQLSLFLFQDNFLSIHIDVNINVQCLFD